MPPDGESFEAEMDELNTSLGKVLKEEQHKASVFTFVPVVWKLPVTGEKGKPGTLKENPNKNFAASHEEITGKTMSDQDVFKAERVFIRDCEEGGAGNKIPQGTKPQFNLSLDHMSLQSPSATARSENTTSHEASGTASMETAVYKHGGVSQPKCHDTSGLSETHKIKLSYKSLAAIPTNTLLLDQQAIDEQVERGESPYDTLDGGVSDTHAEMRSPSQLRQQSEELYAVIDEILANSLPPSPQPPRPTSSNAGLQQNNSSVLKSLGRETKYASLSSLQPTTSMERKSMDNKKTKPGVIRPMTAIPRLTVEDEEEFCPNPFRQFHIKQTSSDNRKEENKSLSKVGKDLYTRETAPERRSPSSMCDLKITEPEDQISHQLKDSSPFSATGKRMNAFETHI
ncbi:muscular LMNA-interacting protein isoform X3 [Cheilinus undulatus]|uniref:muscular LMNA-interacting protein isoform X3 n=1 Tax=Cheilinus undulatus TaxID=241271 RepID=UPI001BD1DA0B|nr:muscular LMNA-interacting protein isoform X3 [Cheilinus undulatus]